MGKHNLSFNDLRNIKNVQITDWKSDFKVFISAPVWSMHASVAVQTELGPVSKNRQAKLQIQHN